MLVEGRHPVPEVRLGAADARVAAADRPVGPIVPADGGAVLVGHRPLATHLVETGTGAVGVVAPALHVLPGVEVRPALAVVVDALPVGEERPAEAVQRRPALVGEVVDEQRPDVRRVGGARREVDQVLHSRHRVSDAERSGRIWRGGGEPAVGGTGPDGDGRRRLAADVPGNVQRRAPANGAVRAVSAGGNAALHHRDELTGVVLHHALQRLLGLEACRGHERLVVVHAQEVEDDLRHRRRARAQERLGVPGAILELEPHQDWLLRLGERVGDLRRR